MTHTSQVGEGQLATLADEEEAEVEKLSLSLSAMCEEGEKAAEHTKVQWMKHADLVNVEIQVGVICHCH
jgi:hypothetical protein